MLQHNLNAALYCRLSRDDGNDSESNSIQNQELILKQYAKNNGFRVIDIYKDDGFTGTNFNRPDFIRMMEDARAKRIDTVIVKDLSRFGREHIQADLYREIEFPQMGVRLIAINDNYDGAKIDHSTNSMAQIKGLFNEWLAADTSEKVRRVYRSKVEQGCYMGIAPFGYMKAPDDKFRLIPDENAAPIVQRIFTMAAAGEGYSAIARAFLAEKIPTPYALAGKKSDKSYTTDYEWDYSTIRAILKNPAYLGHSVHCKKTSVSYKVKKVVQRPQDQWVTVENTHKPLISQATWDLAQAVKATRKRSTKSGTPHMFATLLRCPDCGAPLAKVGEGFTCQRYKLYGKETCSNHYITAKRLAAAVLESIQAVTAEVRQDKAGFIERYTGVNEKQRQQKIGVSRKERDKLTKRLEVLPGLITKAFEQNAGGKLSDDDYAVIMDSYKQEREELTTKLDGLNAAIAEAEQETTGVNEFVALAEQYADLQELDRATLLALIKEIKVHQQYVTEDGQKKQRVDIDYRFIGEL